MAEIEISAIRDEERRRRVSELLPDREDRMKLTAAIFRRAAELGRLGFGAADAAHVAAAEAAKVDAFLTCDDRLLRRARREREALEVRVADPVTWLQEQSDASDA